MTHWPVLQDRGQQLEDATQQRHPPLDPQDQATLQECRPEQRAGEQEDSELLEPADQAEQRYVIPNL